jgi:hypothetical protein
MISHAAAQLGTLFDRSVERLFAWPFWLLALLVLGANILTQGVWMVPNLDVVYLMARDVTRDPYPGSIMQFLFSSYLMPLVAYGVGLNKSPAQYFVLCALVLLIGLALGFGLLRRRFGDETARMVMLLFGATPLINVLLTWIGYGDPLTVALPMLLMALPSPVLRLPVSFLLAIAHFEQGVVIVALICALLPFIDADQTVRRRWLSVAAMVVGLAAGRIAMELYFQMHNFQIENTRSTLVFAKVGVLRFLSDTARYPLVLLFSVMNVSWLAWLLIVVGSWRSDRRLFFVLVLGLGLCLGATVVTLDQTRVAAILTWPLVVGAVIVAARDIDGRALLKKLAVACFLLGIVVPRVIVWEGKIHTSSASFTGMLITDTLGLSNFIDQSKSWWRITPFAPPPPIAW